MNDEPVGVVLTAVSLVPVEAVVTTEGHDGVGDRDSTTEELDSVVEVGDDLDVVEGGSRTDTTECESVDLVCSAELGTAVADGAVGHATGVVSIVRATVCSAVVVGRDAFDLSRTSEVGGGVTEDDDTTPLTAGVVGDRSVERVSLVGEDDGAVGATFSEDLSAFGDDHG